MTDLNALFGLDTIAPAAAPSATRGRDLLRTVTGNDMGGIGRRNGWGPTGSAWKGMGDGDISFPVAERAIFAQGRSEGGIPADDFKAIVREWNGGPVVLGVVGKKYGVLPTGRAVDSVLDTLEQALPTKAFEGGMRRNLIAYKGAMTACEIVLPALRGDIEAPTGHKTTVGYRVILRNTYDGSGSVRLMTGMVDFFCTNGAVSGDFEAASYRHSSGLNVARLLPQVQKSLDRFARDVQRLKVWAKAGLERADVEAALKDVGVSERKQQRLLQMFDGEAEVRGRTMWALMSALTADATHGAVRDTGNDHAAATVLDRQQEAARITERLAQVLVAA
ncbi:hypothetical protein [Microcystis phage MJing1]|nr:hypothetical protein [Microcystis phage MJing1]